MSNNLPATDSSQRKSYGPELRIFLTATLLTFSAGALVMIGYLILGNFFGGFLGFLAALFGFFWWQSLHGKAIPRALPTKPVALLAVATALLFGFLLTLS